MHIRPEEIDQAFKNPEILALLKVAHEAYSEEYVRQTGRATKCGTKARLFTATNIAF